MAVVGRTHGDGVDAWSHRFEQLAEIVELSRVGEGFAGLSQLVVVDVANRHDVAMAPRVG